MFDTSGHLPMRVSIAGLFTPSLVPSGLGSFRAPLTNPMLLDVFVGSSPQNIFNGLQPLRAFSVRRLFGESVENGIHVLSNKPPALFMVIFRGAVPNESALEHSNSAFGINSEDGDVRMSKHT